MASSESSKKGVDLGWSYGVAVEGNKNNVQCMFCDFISKAGISRHKQHLIGGNPNVRPCPKVPLKVREQVKKYVEQKKAHKNTQYAPVTELEEEEEENDVDVEEMLPPKAQRKDSSNESSTGRSKGPIDLYFNQKPNQTKKGENPQVAAKRILRERAVSAFTTWMYEAGLPFNCVNYNESFATFIELVGQHGPGMRPPTYHEVREPYLRKAVTETDKILEEHEKEWERVGCSIMMDKWTARNGKIIINLLVNSPKGSFFLNSIDASNSSTDADKMFKLFKGAIERVGPKNVVQIVTDNASENVKAGGLIQGVYPHIFWTPCAAHCLNLMFGDIFKVQPFAKVFAQAVKVHSYISQRPLLLNMMRKFTKQRNLVKPAKTRFATAFLTLESMYDKRDGLRRMFTSSDFEQSSYAKDRGGRLAKSIILSSTFWSNVKYATTVGTPLIVVLRMVDGEKQPPMGFLYEAMDRAKEKIAHAFKYNERKYSTIFSIIDNRWDGQLHQDLHGAAHLLNPSLFEVRDSTGEAMSGFNACVRKMYPDQEEQDQISYEYTLYVVESGLFGDAITQRMRKKIAPVEWWRLYGGGTPKLQKFAMRILGLTCSSSGCERNWSAFEHIHTKKRNRLELKRLNDLVYVKYNRTLRRRYNARLSLDVIRLDKIDNACEWLTGELDPNDELVYDGDDGIRWGDVGAAAGVEEEDYGLRNITKKRRLSESDKGKGVATSSSYSLIDEEDVEEEDEEQYQDDDRAPILHIDDLNLDVVEDDVEELDL